MSTVNLGEAKTEIASINRTLSDKQKLQQLAKMREKFYQAIADKSKIPVETARNLGDDYLLDLDSLKVYKEILQKFNND